MHVFEVLFLCLPSHIDASQPIQAKFQIYFADTLSNIFIYKNLLINGHFNFNIDEKMQRRFYRNGEEIGGAKWLLEPREARVE